MLATVLPLAAVTPSVIDVERAFARMAQDHGQLTAFRATSAPDAVTSVLQPVNAQKWLKDKTDPPESLRWRPTTTYQFCDGSLAINTGNWQSAHGKTVGFFTTIWKRQTAGSWRWVYDGGDTLPAPRPAVASAAKVVAQCGRAAPTPPPVVGTKACGFELSDDRTLMAFWTYGRGRRTLTIAPAGRVGFIDRVADQP